MIQVLLGHARVDTTALYAQLRTGGHQRDPRGHEPVGSAHAADTGGQAAGISHGDHGSPRPSDRGYLSRLRARPGVKLMQVTSAPWPVEGDVGDRERCRTGGSRRPCHALREDCAHTQIAYNSCRNRHCPKCQGSQALALMKQRKSELLDVPFFHVVFTLAGADCRNRLPEQGRRSTIYCSKLPHRQCARLQTIPSTSAPRSASPRCSTPGVPRLTHHPHVHMIVPGGGISFPTATKGRAAAQTFSCR